MINRITIISLLTIISIAVFSTKINAQCARNIENCKGQCGRFIDNNNDGICDFSKKTEKKAEVKKDFIIKKDLKQIKKTSIVKSANEISICKLDSLKDQFKNLSRMVFQPNVKFGCETSTAKSRYDLIFVSAITIFLYLITYILSKLGKLKVANHRRIWNFILLLAFIFSCLFGFFLVIQINYNILPKVFMTILYWHVEIGIAMTIILVFHIFWHLKYYINSFK